MPDKFDPVAAWKALTPEQQSRIGAAAMIITYTQAVASCVGPGRALGFEAADFHAHQVIWGALRQIVLPAREVGSFPLLPDLSPIGIRACRGCGCTDEVGCPEGCRWVTEDLCSACSARRGGVRRW